jgi:hypothetical protein
MNSIKKACFALIAVCMTVFLVVTQVLASDINPSTVSSTISFPYQNSFGSDALMYFVVDVEQSIDKDTLKPSDYLESSTLTEFGPSQVIAGQGVALVNSKPIKPTDAQVGQDNGNLRYLLTSGACTKTTGIDGCNWDIDGKNKWNPKTLACGESVNECSAKNKGFVNSATQKTANGKGGQFNITFTLKPGAKISAYNVFPVKVYQVNPLFAPEKKLVVNSTITVSNTTAQVASVTPVVASSSSVSSAVSSKPISSSSVSSSSLSLISSSISPVSVASTKASTPPPPTTGAVENASAFGVLLTVLISLSFGYLIAQSSPKKQVVKVDLD